MVTNKRLRLFDGDRLRDFILKIVECVSFAAWVFSHLRESFGVYKKGQLPLLEAIEDRVFRFFLDRKMTREVMLDPQSDKIVIVYGDGWVPLYRDGSTCSLDMGDKMSIYEAEEYAWAIIAAADLQEKIEKEMERQGIEEIAYIS